MDIEAEKRSELISYLADGFHCVEECRLQLLGFDEMLRADVVAFSRLEAQPWVLAFEVKVPTYRWELKNWFNALRQAGNYPNCVVADENCGAMKGRLVNASFVCPAPDLKAWSSTDSQSTRFYRDYDFDPLRGAILLAQHFKVGTANFESRSNKLSLKLGTDTVWDNRSGFREKAKNLLERRKIGSLKRSLRA